MNIPELSTALSNVKIADQVSVAVLDKALESADAPGAGILNLMARSMELAVTPNIGSNIDIFV